MYNVFKSVINNTPFSLTDITKKINTNWVQSYLSDAQREELLALAQEKAEPNNDLAPLTERVDALALTVAELTAEVALLKGDTEPTEDEPTEVEEFPEYVKPESKDAYYTKGDKVTYKGKKYIFVGNKNNPSDPITYPYAVNKDGTIRGWLLYDKYDEFLASQSED